MASTISKEQKQPASSALRRIVWFAGLWLASVAALALVAYGIRFFLKP